MVHSGAVMAGKMNSALHFGHALQLAFNGWGPTEPPQDIQGRFGVSRGQGLRIGILRRFSWREKSISKKKPENDTQNNHFFVECYGHA